MTTSSPDLPRYYRPLGLHERYSLARAQAGFPVNLSIVARVTCDSDLAFTSSLKARIDELLNAYPLLSAGITDDRSSQPGFYRMDGQCSHHKVLQLRNGLGGSLLAGESNNDIALGLLRAELWECGEGGAALSSLQNPMWRVIVRQGEEKGHCWFSLSASHIIIDGKGLANLFELLLASEIKELLPATSLSGIPPSSDQVFNTSPSFLHLASVVWAELVIPQLPSRLQSLLKSSQHWPTPVPINPTKSTPEVDLVLLESDLVKKLKKTAMSRGISTITPLLHSAAFIALFSIIGFHKTILSATPISMRSQAGSKATLCTGNFVSSAEFPLKATSESSFWTVTKEYTAVLINPETAQKGLKSMGMLAYIPNDMRDPPPKKQPPLLPAGDIAAPSPTSWEHFFRQKAQSLSPYASSFDLTNVGLVKTQAKIQNVVFSPSPAPLGAAYLISVIGFSSDQVDNPSNGLSITVATRKGLVDGGIFARRMKKAVMIFADNTQISDNATLGDLVKLVMK